MWGFAKRQRPPGRAVLLGVVAGAVGLLAGWQLQGGRGADASEDADALARTQLERFFAGTTGKAELSDLLGEAFQLMRTDGTRFDRAGYLARPSALQSYSLEGIEGIQAGDVLTATFFAGVTGTVGEVARDATALPRLAVFTREKGEWKLQAYANLGSGSVADPAAEGAKAVETWMGALSQGDAAAIGRLLAPDFQLARADGTSFSRADYLAQGVPPPHEKAAVEQLVVTAEGDTLVARYWLTFKQPLAGIAAAGRAQQLTVFRRVGPDWLVVAHANFARAD